MTTDKSDTAQNNTAQNNTAQDNTAQAGPEQARTEQDPKETRQPSLWQRIRNRLSKEGIYIGINDIDGLDEINIGDLGFDDLENLKVEIGGENGGIKVVCVSPDLKASAEEMKGTQRDQVVMVRVDEETRDTLDAWVKTGAVKSRSEAAALFIREGLKVRADELERLRDALREVEAAQERLQQQAREIFGGGDSV